MKLSTLLTLIPISALFANTGFSQEYQDITKLNYLKGPVKANAVEQGVYSIYGQKILSQMQNQDLWNKTISSSSLKLGKVWMCNFTPTNAFAGHQSNQDASSTKFVPLYQLDELAPGWYENRGIRSVKALVNFNTEGTLASEDAERTFIDFLTVNNNGDLLAETTVHISHLKESMDDPSQYEYFMRNATLSPHDENRVVIGHHFCPASKVEENSKSIDDLIRIDSDDNVLKTLLRPTAEETPFVSIIGNKCKVEVLKSTREESVNHKSRTRGRSTKTGTYYSVYEYASDFNKTAYSYNIIANGEILASVDETVRLSYNFKDNLSNRYNSLFVKNFIITTFSNRSSGWTEMYTNRWTDEFGNSRSQELVGNYSRTNTKVKTTEQLSDALTEKELHFKDLVMTILRSGACE